MPTSLGQFLGISLTIFIGSTILFVTALWLARQREPRFGGDVSIPRSAARPSLATLSFIVSVLSLISSTLLGILTLLKH